MSLITPRALETLAYQQLAVEGARIARVNAHLNRAQVHTEGRGKAEQERAQRKFEEACRTEQAATACFDAMITAVSAQVDVGESWLRLEVGGHYNAMMKGDFE